jgi:hypothetical protein
MEYQAKAANLRWCIWKARNEEVIEGQKIQPLKVVHQARAMEHVGIPPAMAQYRKHEILEVPRDHKLILVDGSRDQQEKAGVAAIIYDENDQLLELRS